MARKRQHLYFLKANRDMCLAQLSHAALMASWLINTGKFLKLKENKNKICWAA